MSQLLPALPVPNFVLLPACTVSLQFGFPALQDQLHLAQREGGKIVVAHSEVLPIHWTEDRRFIIRFRDLRQGFLAQFQAAFAGT